MGGWLIWTAMKMSPAAAALRPAARVRPLVVIVMADSWSLGAERSVRPRQRR